MGSLEITDLPQDMTKEEKEVVMTFITNGCPGLVKVQQSDIFQYFQLYMSGKTYAEIATITKVSKTLIMFLSYKARWMELKFKHYEDISLNLLDKIQKVKLDIANNLVTMINAKGKYLEKEHNRYLSTNDKTIMDGLKDVESGYFKSIAALDRVLNTDDEGGDDKKPKQPLVNINMGMGAKATIEQKGENKLEITDETAGELVKALASMKKSTIVK